MCQNGHGDFKKRKLSQSDKGLGMKVSWTASPGGAIHVATSSAAANEWDEVWLWAINQSASPVTLTILWGWTATQDQIKVTLPANSTLTQVIPGLVLHGGASVNVFASTTDVVVVHGYVNRYEMTP
jgi:hypothetical protein